MTDKSALNIVDIVG